MVNIIFPTDTTAVTVAVDDLLLVSDTSASWAAKEATALGVSLCGINDATTTTTNLWSADKINTVITTGLATKVTGSGTSSGTNTGDQTSIVWISGTMAQFDTACSNWDFVYQSWALWTPASWTLTNATWLPIAWLVASTSTAIGVWSINLWHASDTTITRVSAGLIAVEWVTLVDVSTVQTLTNKTLTSPTLTTPSAFTTGGTITLAENTSIALDPAWSADGKYTGITITGTGGATIAFGDLVTLDKDDSRWELVDISVAAAATWDARWLLGMAVTSSTDGAAITVLLLGTIRADANFPALTIGAAVYASTTWDIVVTQPSTTDHVIRIVWHALTADEIMFNPDWARITHT